MADNFDFMDGFDNFDYGFTAVSADEVDKTEQQGQKIEEVSQSSIAIDNKINQLIESVGRVLTLQQEKNTEEIKNKMIELEDQVALKMSSVEKLILPLLVNLYKTADEPYIHWPNRQKIVKDQIDKLLAITRPGG
tara:strand:+ start:1131 stop:1535 length:405 start_codon:yes stop_codon:yes gene_type:complete